MADRENNARAKYFRDLAKFMAGVSDIHPGGASQHNWMIDAVLTSNCRDTSPCGYDFSAWGNAAGFCSAEAPALRSRAAAA